MATARSTSPDTRIRSGGTTVFACVFSVWLLGVSTLVAALAREGCGTTLHTLSGQLGPAGWSLRHELDLRHPDSANVARLLKERGPEREVASVVRLTEAGPWEAELRRRGWIVEIDGPRRESPQAPAISVVSPAGEERWRGTYPPEVVFEEVALIDPSLLFAELAAGRSPPPVVPLLCTAPLPSR